MEIRDGMLVSHVFFQGLFRASSIHNVKEVVHGFNQKPSYRIQKVVNLYFQNNLLSCFHGPLDIVFTLCYDFFFLSPPNDFSLQIFIFRVKKNNIKMIIMSFQ